MKKIIALIFTIAMLLSTALTLASCGGTTKLDVGYMTGPTGMGMAKLIHDNAPAEDGTESEKYAFTKYLDTKTAFQDLAKGAADIICVPTNEAAKYYTGTDDSIVVLSINTLGSVYLVAKNGSATAISSISDLEGKTIHTCLNGTPRMILEYILIESGVNATVSTTYGDKTLTTPDMLKTTLSDPECNIELAVAPEPIVTAVGANYSVKLNLNNVWNEISDTALTMGCIVSTKEFVAENKKAVDAFLDEYKASIEYVNAVENADNAAAYIVEAGIMGAAGAAKKALGNLRGSIVYMDGEAMKAALVGFYEAMNITQPDDEFYYEK